MSAKRAVRVAVAAGLLGMVPSGCGTPATDTAPARIAAAPAPVADDATDHAGPTVVPSAPSADVAVTTSTSTTAPPPPTTTRSTTTATAPRPAPQAGDGLAPPLARPWSDHFAVAHADRSPLSVSASPNGPPKRSFVDPTPEGLPLVFLVRDATPDGQWVHVQLPIRPNGAMGWVRRSDVALTQVNRHIVVRRSQDRMAVMHGETVVVELPVSVGAPASPTPLGTFYVDGLHQVIGATDGDYGAFQISFTGFSTVYSHFAGGIGQAAFHGTNRPDLIGSPASHGCVRLTNEDILRLARLIPIGTPVEVVP